MCNVDMSVHTHWYENNIGSTYVCMLVCRLSRGGWKDHDVWEGASDTHKGIIYF